MTHFKALIGHVILDSCAIVKQPAYQIGNQDGGKACTRVGHRIGNDQLVVMYH